jgi:hypothetical protein
MAIQLHAHYTLDSSATEFRRELAGRSDAAARQQALDDALNVADLRPGTDALFVAVGLARQGGANADADRFAVRATRREPRNFATWVTLGVVRRAAGHERAALAAFARAKQLNPRYRTPR